MPSGSGTNAGLRLLTVAAIALAIVVVGFLLLRGGDGSYRVVMTLDNANQLVEGNQVKVGGVPVGSVAKIGLADDGRARIELSIKDDGPAAARARHPRDGALDVAVGHRQPLRRAAAWLDGDRDDRRRRRDPVVGRPRSRSTWTRCSTRSTRRRSASCSMAVKGLGGAIDPEAGKDLNAGLRALNPALSQVGLTEAEILRDQERFERFIVESADVVSAVAERDERLPSLVSGAHATLDAVARRSENLESSLERLPPDAAPGQHDAGRPARRDRRPAADRAAGPAGRAAR